MRKLRKIATAIVLIAIVAIASAQAQQWEYATLWTDETNYDDLYFHWNSPYKTVSSTIGWDAFTEEFLDSFSPSTIRHLPSDYRERSYISAWLSLPGAEGWQLVDITQYCIRVNRCDTTYFFRRPVE